MPYTFPKTFPASSPSGVRARKVAPTVPGGLQKPSAGTKSGPKRSRRASKAVCGHEKWPQTFPTGFKSRVRARKVALNVPGGLQKPSAGTKSGPKRSRRASISECGHKKWPQTFPTGFKGRVRARIPAPNLHLDKAFNNNTTGFSH